MKRTYIKLAIVIFCGGILSQTDVLIPYRDKNSWGFADTNKKVIIPCEYNYVFPFNKESALVMKDNKWGFINKKGDIICPFVFDKLIYGYGGYYCFLQDDSYVFSDAEGNVIRKFKPDLFHEFSEGMGIYELNGRLGYVDIKGNEISDCVYDYANPFSYGYAKVGINGKFGYINHSGALVIPCEYENIEIVGDSYFVVKNNNLSGVLSIENKPLVPVEYDDIKWDVVLDAFLVKKNGHWGLLKNNKIILHTEYDKIYTLPSKLMVVYKNKKAGLFDTLGRCIMPINFDNINFGINGYIEFRSGSKIGLANKNGEIILPAEYENIVSENDTSFVVLKNKRVHSLHKKSGKLIPLTYNDMGFFLDNQDFLWVRKGNKYGVTDEQFKILIPFKYEDVSYFKDNVLLAKFNGKWGAIHMNGKTQIPFKYDDIQSINLKKYFIVENKGKKGITDINGNEIINCLYDDICMKEDLMKDFTYLILYKNFLISDEKYSPMTNSDTNDNTKERKVTLAREMGYISDKYGVFFKD